ncbi:MAG: hypothetical protein U0R19_40335 [Bryobacteraceae bacterium]
MESLTMQFVLRGFSQVVGLRVFAFEGIATDRTRAMYTVSADLAMSRRYGIRLQELPLLCRSVLERCHEGGEIREFNYSEEQMRLHADGAAARDEAAKRRKPPRRPATENVGAAWRGPMR